MNATLPVLQDGCDRAVTYLRVSVTDRCNYRCTYCMPEAGVEWLPRSTRLSFEEIRRLVSCFQSLGVHRVRLTGGEPTVRSKLPDLVSMLASTGIRDIAMTSNAHLLADLAEPLATAGMTGINISLDTVDPTTFAELTRRGTLDRVVAGIDASIDVGLEVKLNTVVMGGVNDHQLGDICRFAWDRGITPRFIEYMPFSSGTFFEPIRHIGAKDIRRSVARAFASTVAPSTATGDNRGPARYYRIAANRLIFGVISAVSEGFCETCNRVRLSASGDLHPCLGDDGAVSLRDPLRDGATDEELVELIRSTLRNKAPGHSLRSCGGGAPRKNMSFIGG